MKSPNQKQIWDSIAKDWNKWKTTSDSKVREFVSQAQGNLIDLGCGSGRNFSKTQAKIYAIDFSKEMLKHAKTKSEELKLDTELINQDITKKLKFKNNFFDAAICIATLHCIEGKENQQKVLKEIYRVLKPEAKLLIKVWNRKNPKFHNKKERLVKWLDKGERYYYFYDKEELEEELKKENFKIISSESQDDKGFEKQEIVILVKKTNSQNF